MARPAPDELDLRGLDARAAREYVLAFVMTLKEAERQRGKLASELGLWTERAALARSKGRGDLADAAEARAAGIQPRLAEAEAEENRLRAGASVLKERLRLKMHGEVDRSIDSEKLEADLEMLVGEGRAADLGAGSTPPPAEPEELKKQRPAE